MNEGAFDALYVALVATEHEFGLSPAEAAELTIELASFALSTAMMKAARDGSEPGTSPGDLSLEFEQRLEGLMLAVTGDWLAECERLQLRRRLSVVR